MDTKTLAHIGGELVVVSGLIFWFQKKTTSLQQQINSLQQIIQRQDEALKQYGQLLQTHNSILQGGHSQGGPSPKKRRSSKKKRSRRNKPPRAKLQNDEVELDNAQLDEELDGLLGGSPDENVETNVLPEQRIEEIPDDVDESTITSIAQNTSDGVMMECKDGVCIIPH